MGECAVDEEEQQHEVAERLNARIGEAKCRDALVVDDDGSLQVLEGRFADKTVMADALDVEQTSVGGKADLAQVFEIFDASADGEVAGIVDGGFGAEGLVLFVILLDTVFLVVNVQRRHDAFGDDTGAKPAGGTAGDLAIEHQADLAGTADIEVLADHLLEEDPSGHRLVEHLGERELGLQDRELVAIAGGAITGRKRMRQASQPFAQQPIDFFR